MLHVFLRGLHSYPESAFAGELPQNYSVGYWECCTFFCEGITGIQSLQSQASSCEPHSAILGVLLVLLEGAGSRVCRSMEPEKGSKRPLDLFEDAMEQARRSSRQAPVMRLPWETNSWLRQTMPGSSRPADYMTGAMNDLLSARLIMPPLIPELPRVGVPVRAMENKFGEALTKMLKTRHRATAKSEDALRAHALSRWTTIIGLGPESFRVCRQALSDAEITGKLELRTVLEDALASRSTNTLLSRSGPLLRFGTWCRLHSLQIFPICESTAYLFLSAQRSAGSAPTFAAGFSCAVNFAMGLLGLDGAAAVSSSGRIRGLSFAEFTKKRVLLQRRPLLVREVLYLEMQLFSDDRLVLSCVCGLFLLLLNLRARFSDVTCITSYEKDLSFLADDSLTGYIECTTSRTKTGKSKENTNMLLPLCGLAVSLRGRDWFERWLKVRSAAGIPLQFPLEDKPFFPAPESLNTFSDRAISNAECNAWLRDSLATCGVADPDTAGCHSLKCTPLSWVAKWAPGDKDLSLNRKLLGYHSPSNDQSLLIYSRDAMGAPLKLLETVVEDIRLGAFLPDEPRTKRTVHESSRVPIESEYVFPLPDPDDDESAGSVSDTSDSDSDGAPKDEASAVVDSLVLQDQQEESEDFKNLREQGFTLHHHKYFMTAHWKFPGVETLACGRRITAAIIPFNGKALEGMPLCKQCQDKV